LLDVIAQQLGFGYTADIVLAEDGGFEHKFEVIMQICAAGCREC
jgi:hypothetical protein